MRQRGDRIEYLGKQGCEDIRDNHSRNTYRRGVESLVKWAETFHSIKYTGQIQRAGFEGFAELIQAYLKDMASGSYTRANGKPYSAATISTYGKAVCYAFGVDYKSVNAGGIVPRRTAGRITKGTGRGGPGANKQGRLQLLNPKYKNFVLLSQVTGIRRSELEQIRGRNLVTDESGHLCIEVESGKGGKHQLQRIMPWEQAEIRRLFSGKKPKEFVLTKSETNNKIDVHYIRARRCQTCYEYYMQQIRTGGTERLKTELLARWNAEHIRGNSPKDKKALERFKQDMNNKRPYILRGENKEVARKRNRPTEYNRLAMLCVSVFCLSHWRLDVTSVNYLTR